MILRRFPVLSGVLIGFFAALFLFGNLDVWLRSADAQVPFGAFRIMDGTHTQLARVNHTGQLAVDATVSVTTDNVNVFHQSTIRHISSVTHVGGGVSLIGRDGTYVSMTSTRLDVECTGCAAASVVAVSHISAAVHIGGTIEGARFHIQGLGVPGASHGGVLTVQGVTGMIALSVGQSTQRWNVDHVTSVLHIQVAGAGIPGASLSVRCVNTGGTAFADCGGAGGSGDAVNVFHQSTIRHISSVTHIASAGLAIANQALAVRCVDTGGTTFQACGGGSDPASVVQSSSWTIQAAHQVVISHISAVVHVASYGVLHIQGRGTPGDSHGGVLTIQGITGMNALVVSQATASSLQMTATQTGTWTVQPGNTPNTTAWLVNAGHISSVTHIAGSMRLMSGTPNNQLAIVTHFGALAVTCYTSAGATESCGGTGGSGDAVNVFHQSTIRHISSVTHVSIIDWQRWAHVQTQTFQSGSWTVQAAHQGGEWNVRHVGSVIHMALMSVAGTPLGLGTGLPIGHITSVIHISAAGTPWNFNMALAIRCVNTGATAFESCGGTVTSDTVNVFHQSTIAHVSSVTHVMVAQHQVIRVMGAHVTGAIHVAGLTNVGSGAPGTGTTQMVCHSTLAIHVAAAAPGYTQIIHLTSSNGGINQAQWRIYICSIMVVSAHAQGFSLLEGVGTTCMGQPRHAVIGSWRPDDSVVLAANGGFSLASPFPFASTQVPGNNLCIGQTTRTSGGSISGTMSYRAGP